MADLTIAQDMLNNTCTALFTQYTQLKGSLTGSVTQKDKLTERLAAIRNQVRGYQKEGDVYDREFLDRREAGEGNLGVMGRLGFKTLQDWVLGAFFGSYILAVLMLMLHTTLYSQTVLKGLALILVSSIILGILVSVMILRMG